MSGDTIYRVMTVYETDSAGAEAGANRIASKHDMITGALTRTASSLTGVFDRAASAATGIVVALGSALAITGVSAMVYGVTRLNAEAEDARISIAGMFQAGGAAAGGAGGFNAALGMSDDIIARMRVHANALPGEFRDLQNVFEGGLIPGLESGRTAQQIEGLSASFMAVSQTFRVESQTAGRELNMLLEGRAGSHLVMWSRLSGIIGKTAQDWNAMSRAQRFDALQAAMSRFDPMVRAYGSSWAAVSSTTRDHVTQLLRIGTAPLFERVKADLGLVNGWFERNQARIEQMAQSVGGRLAHAFDVIVSRVSHLVQMVQHFSLHEAVAGAEAFASRIGGATLAARAALGLMSSPGALAGIGGAVGGGSLAGAGILAAIALPLIAAISDGSVDVRHVISQLSSNLTPLVGALTSLWTVTQPLLSLLGVSMVETVTNLATVFGFLAGKIQWLLDHMPGGSGNQPMTSASGGGAMSTGANGGLRTPEEQNAADSGALDTGNWRNQTRFILHSALSEAFHNVTSPLEAGRSLVDTLGGHDIERDRMRGIDNFNAGGPTDTMPMAFRALAHARSPSDLARSPRPVNTPQGHTTIHIRLETTINDASDPNRVVSSMRHLLSDTVRHAVESAHSPVLR